MSSLETRSGEAEETRSRSGLFGGLLLGVIAGAALMVALSQMATRAVQPNLWDRVVAAVTGRSGRTSADLPAVIAGIERLQRLQTVAFTMDKVVEGERQSEYLPDFLAGDKLLLVVHGQVTAGVDLGQVHAGDVRVEGRAVEVHLPQAEVFSAALDSQHTRVYSRTTGLLVSADPNLESEVRARAEQEIRDAAVAGGILDTAQSNARSTVESLLRSVGFEQIRFR